MSLKANMLIEKAMLTGILTISSKQLMSGANHLGYYDISSSALANVYGITER